MTATTQGGRREGAIMQAEDDLRLVTSLQTDIAEGLVGAGLKYEIGSIVTTIRDDLEATQAALAATRGTDG